MRPPSISHTILPHHSQVVHAVAAPGGVPHNLAVDAAGRAKAGVAHAHCADEESGVVGWGGV